MKVVGDALALLFKDLEAIERHAYESSLTILQELERSFEALKLMYSRIQDQVGLLKGGMESDWQKASKALQAGEVRLAKAALEHRKLLEFELGRLSKHSKFVERDLGSLNIKIKAIEELRKHLGGMLKTSVKDMDMVDKALSHVRSLVKELMNTNTLINRVGETLEKTRVRLEAVDKFMSEGVLPLKFRGEVYEWRGKMKDLKKVVEEEVKEILKQIQ